jgi:hypothetical protein
MAGGMSVPVTDQQGKPAGTLTLNQATGTIQFAGQDGGPLGSVVMDPATGAPVVVGQGGTVLGSLKVTQVITFIPAGQGTGAPSAAPVTSTGMMPPGSAGGPVAAPGPTTGSTAMSSDASATATTSDAALAAAGMNQAAAQPAGPQTAALAVDTMPTGDAAGTVSTSPGAGGGQPAVLTASIGPAPAGRGTPGGADPVPMALGNSGPAIPVGPAPASRNGPTVSGGIGVSVPFDPVNGFGTPSPSGTIFVTPPPTIGGVSTGGSVPLSIGPLLNALGSPAPVSSPSLPAASPRTFELDPMPQFNQFNDPIYQGLIQSIGNQATPVPAFEPPPLPTIEQVFPSQTRGDLNQPGQLPTGSVAVASDDPAQAFLNAFASSPEIAAALTPPGQPGDSSTQLASLTPQGIPAPSLGPGFFSGVTNPDTGQPAIQFTPLGSGPAITFPDGVSVPASSLQNVFAPVMTPGGAGVVLLPAPPGVSGDVPGAGAIAPATTGNIQIPAQDIMNETRGLGLSPDAPAAPAPASPQNQAAPPTQVGDQGTQAPAAAQSTQVAASVPDPAGPPAAAPAPPPAMTPTPDPAPAVTPAPDPAPAPAPAPDPAPAPAPAPDPAPAPVPAPDPAPAPAPAPDPAPAAAPDPAPAPGPVMVAVPDFSGTLAGPTGFATG